MKASFKNILKFFLCFCLCVLAGVFFAACSAIQSDYRYKGGSSSDSGSSSGGSGGSSGGGSSSDQGGSGGDVTPDVPTSDEITIRYDYGAASNFFGTLDEITLYETIKTNVGIVKLPMIKSQYSDAFLGWFNVSTDEKVKIGDKPQTDIDVYAKFDVDKLGLAGLFENKKYVKTWDRIKQENPDAFFGTAIMSNAGFSYFTNLKGDLIIGSDITEVQAYAFEACEQLTSITIPNGVTTVGESAFSSCSKLETLKIGMDVTSIGKLAFAECHALKNVYYNATSCNALASASYIFKNDGTENDDGFTITIGKGVTKIPNYFCGFYGENNSKLTNIVFEDVSSLSEIGTYAFRNCTSLNNVTFPNSLTKIGQYAFNGCSAFTNVTIPQNVTTVGNYAFGECLNLTQINFNATAISSYGSSYVFQNAGKSTAGITVTVGNNVTKIPAYFLFGSSYSTGNMSRYAPKIASVSIGSSVTSIGNSAFACAGITSIVIPNSVTSMGTYVFQYCTELTNVTLSSGITNISNYTFLNCTKLTTVTIPNSVKTISAGVFSGCSKLSSITLPSGLTSIGNYAFRNCSSLISLTIPKTVTSIGTSYPFAGCDSLTSFSVESGNSTYHSSGNCVIKTSTKELIAGCKTSVIPNDGSVTSIKNYAFCVSGLTSLTIPASVTDITSLAIYECVDLSSLTVEPGNTKYHSAGNCIIETATGKLVDGCNGSVIPTDGSVTSIVNEAFHTLTKLTSVTVPEGVTSMTGYIFAQCTGLRELYLPSTLTKLPHTVFANCTSLRGSASDVKIHFNGTVEKFNSLCSGGKCICKPYSGSHTFYVQCTDGVTSFKLTYTDSAGPY